MKKLFLTGIIYSLMTASVLWAQGWRPGEMEVRVNIIDQYTATTLSALGLNGDYGSSLAVLYVIPREKNLLDQAGITYEITKKDLNAYYEDFWNQRAAYHSYEEIVDLADSLAAEFPDICQKYLFGESMGGRELGALKISDNAMYDENEAEVFFDGGIHGDEIGGPENCIRFARDLCTKYGNDPEITNLVNNREIWIYYMVNPDGRVNMVRYNNAGVDLNRDYGYMWDAWGGSTGAFSQVETQSLRNCAYQNQFVVHTTYHSGTEYISCPWSYRPETPPDMDHILQLAGLYSSESGYADLEYGQGNSGMYAINGSTKDGNYGANGAISWSMEISYDKQPPASQLMQYYDWNYPSMIKMIEYAGYGLEGTVTDAESGDPVRATVFVNDYMQTFTDSTAGDYHKYVLPGKYMITIVANGYETMTTADSVEVFELSSTVTDFQLTPLDSSRWYAWRIISSQIPGNNTVDEGNTKALIGAPDMINYSIGKDGWVVVDMQKPIVDLPGNDIKVYEGDFPPEGFSCYAGTSMDGPWIFLGEGNGTTEFELAIAGLDEARYFKIQDDGDGLQNVDNAGFDLDAVSDMEHEWGVYMVMYDYELEDESGNNHLEQGESADLIVELMNSGNVTANNVTATLSSASPYVNITLATASYGTLPENQSGSGTFSFEIDESFPNGDTLIFTLDVLANSGIYSTSFEIAFVVGQYPILIVDLDGNTNSGMIMQYTIEDLDLTSHYRTSFPDDLNLYKSVFVCLGVYNNAHPLSNDEGQMLADYLNNGGRLYMEGGDTWYYDDPTPVHPMFKINGESDGGNDLGLIMGQDASFAEGLSYQYIGDNNYIDHIEPLENAFELFRNQIPSYCNAVALDEGSYKTVGVSFEFGGLADNASSTKEELMMLILEFFGGILTTVDETQPDMDLLINAWPNPFSESVNFDINMTRSQKVSLEIFDARGQRINTLVNRELSTGNHRFSWNGTSASGLKASEGLYFYIIRTGRQLKSGKIILAH